MRELNIIRAVTVIVGATEYRAVLQNRRNEYHPFMLNSALQFTLVFGVYHYVFTVMTEVCLYLSTQLLV